MKNNTHTVIVTGAAQGIGQAIVARCLKEKSIVVACDKDKKGLKALKLLFQNKRLRTYALDVSDFTKVAKFFVWLKKNKIHPNHLVNNAGIYLGKKFTDYSLEEMHRVFNVNLLGAIYLSQLFGRLLIRGKKRGSIVNISSVSAQEGSSDPIYGVTKAGLIGLTKSCAMNFSPYIRVNALAPGVVETTILKNIPKWRLKEYRKAELIHDPILASDIASSVWFLLSEEGSHYTGSVLDINNGCYIRA